MPLIRPYLSRAFVDALAKPNGAHTTFSRVGVVGADTDWISLPENITDFSLTTQAPADDHMEMSAYRFMDTEEIYMDASNQHLTGKGFAISPDADFRVCEIDYDCDLLEGGFNGFKCDLLELHSLWYDPHDNRTFGTATQQSPHAKNPKKWIQTFKDSNSKAIVNMWNPRDWKRGAAISQLIVFSGNKGGSIHIRNDIAAEFSL
jgi:hypothetical protein